MRSSGSTQRYISSQAPGTCSASKLATLRNTIGYLIHSYIIASAEVVFSDRLADVGVIIKENLAVLQLMTKTRQNIYGVIAITTTVIVDPAIVFFK